MSAVFSGYVVHQRLRPRPHRLRYRIFMLLLDLDDLPATARRLRLFDDARPALFRFRARDHGDGGTDRLKEWVERRLREAGLPVDGGRVRMLSMPRVLGHAFNPLSVYFCHRRDGSLLAMLYQVNNTFGHRHTYVVPVTGTERGWIRQAAEKCFYVSPFLDMDMHYAFHIREGAAGLDLVVNGHDSEGLMLAASFKGKRQPLSDWTLFRQFAAMPLQGAKVVGGIYVEALQLWWKGVRFHRRPRTGSPGAGQPVGRRATASRAGTG